MKTSEHHISKITEAKKLLHLAYPIIIGQTGHMLTHTADIIMVGRVGSVPLAAAAFAASVFIVIYLLGLGIATAITPLVGRAAGERDITRQHDIFRAGAVALGISFTLLTLIGLAIYPFLDYFGQPPEVVVEARPYYVYIILSILPTAFFQQFKQYCEGLSLTKPPTVLLVVANILNVIFNYILIYGHLGAPAMGVSGAGLATLLSKIFLAVASVVFMLRYAPTKAAVKAMWERKPTISEITEIFRLGLPISFQMVLEAGAFAGGAIISGTLGATSMSAHQIVINVASITFLIANAVGSASTIVLSTYRGEGKFSYLRPVGLTALGLSSGFMTLTAGVFVLFNTEIPLLYIEDPAVLQLAGNLFIVAGLFQIFDGIQTTMLCALRGLEDVQIPSLLSFVAYWVLGLPVSYYLARHTDIGVIGVWYGYLTGLCIVSVLLVARFLRVSAKLSIIQTSK